MFQLGAYPADLVLVVVLEAFFLGLKLAHALLVLLAELVRHVDESSLVLELLLIALDRGGKRALLLLQLDEGIVGLGLHG
ncbi:MAG: hypothetical protein B7X77_03540, partial [Caulobacter sp. 39-67-4]